MKGMANHPLYKVFTTMVRRCYLPTDKAFKWYGARGIKICQEWIDNRDTFYEWALPLWGAGLQIDRIDNDGDYKPDNCRFVTCQENSHNRRGFVLDHRRAQIRELYSKGEKIARIARLYDISRPTVYAILKEPKL
jgi:hypothetical protein